jgi:hypothetical protein
VLHWLQEHLRKHRQRCQVSISSREQSPIRLRIPPTHLAANQPK